MTATIEIQPCGYEIQITQQDYKDGEWKTTEIQIVNDAVGDKTRHIWDTRRLIIEEIKFDK